MKILTLGQINELHSDYKLALAKKDQVAMRQAEDYYMNSFAIFPGNLSDLIRDTNENFRGWTPNSADGRVYKYPTGLIYFKTFNPDPSQTRDIQLKFLTLMQNKVVGMTNPQEALESMVIGMILGFSSEIKFITKGYAFRHATKEDMPYDSSG